jgi:hypothetical protein
MSIPPLNESSGAIDVASFTAAAESDGVPVSQQSEREVSVAKLSLNDDGDAQSAMLAGTSETLSRFAPQEL